MLSKVELRVTSSSATPEVRVGTGGTGSARVVTDGAYHI